MRIEQPVPGLDAIARRSFMTLGQSDAMRAFETARSSARAKASLHAHASRVAGSVTPWNATADAPRNTPRSLRHTTPTAFAWGYNSGHGAPGPDSLTRLWAS